MPTAGPEADLEHRAPVHLLWDFSGTGMAYLWLG